MAKDLILTKESSESEIKAYFDAVLKLSQSDNEFPINFDEVWMLVYQDKHKAVNELKEKFIEDVDYQAVTQKVECKNGIGYSRRVDYFLTVSCMEFFIARKVRPVFEVYRQVFHKVAKHELSRKELALMVIQAEEEKERLALENEKQQKQIEKLQPKADFADAAFKAEGKVDIGQAAKILGLPFGRNTLFKKLREMGVFFANRNEPKQKYIDAGYFEMTLLPPIHRDNHPDIICQKVLCNPKGLAFINFMFGGNPPENKLSPIV